MKPNLMLEDEVEELIVLDASESFNCDLWRNNSGRFQTEAGFVSCGLGNVSKKWNESLASSDEIGGTPVLITPEMVGKTVFILTSIEVKREGWKYTGKASEPQQKNWIDLIKGRGGIAGFASSVDEYRQIMKDYLFSLKDRSN